MPPSPGHQLSEDSTSETPITIEFDENDNFQVQSRAFSFDLEKEPSLVKYASKPFTAGLVGSSNFLKGCKW